MISDFFRKYQKLIISILVPLLFGFIGYILGGNTEIYNEINTPPFAPPSFLFPIVWSILYVLMGISSYLISNETNNSLALFIYYLQLIVNSLWPLFFFRLNWFFFSFLWILLLIALVAYMIYLFYKLDKRAALLQIPYLLWLIFAAILNFSIACQQGRFSLTTFEQLDVPFCKFLLAKIQFILVKATSYINKKSWCDSLNQSTNF